jgi:hypothetical protein
MPRPLTLPRLSVTPHAPQREDMMDSDKEKESTLTPSAQEAIRDAARANVNAAVEVGKSAISSFVGALTGERKKSRTTRRGAKRKKVASKGAASKRVKRATGGRRSTGASSRGTTRKSASSQKEPKRPSTRKTRSAAATRRSTRKTAARKARRSAQAKRGTSKSRSLKPRRSRSR